MSNRNFIIMKCLVGSKAYKLDNEFSDTDTKSVFLWPTSKILKIGVEPKIKQTVKEDEDNMSMEMEHFLRLSLSSNPTILELYKSPILESDNIEMANELRNLFPYVFSSKGVYNAYFGYSRSQHKRMFNESNVFKERSKLAVAHLRVLIQGIELLRTGTFSVEVLDKYDVLIGLKEHHSWNVYLKDIKNGLVDIGQIINTSELLKAELDKAYQENPNKEKDLEPVNNFLLKIRKEYWDDNA